MWNTKDKPKGMKQFYQALAMLKVPKNIVVNEIGKSTIRKFRNSKDNMWRPPGQLDKKSYKI